MILEHNKKFLSKKVLKELEIIKYENNIIFKSSKDNFLVPVVNNVSLHSTYFPLKESEKIKIPEDEGKEIIAIGFGAGYHLVNLAKTRKIICISIDPEILKQVLEKIDLSVLFNEKNLFIIDKKEIIDYFDFFNHHGFDIIIHSVLEKLFPQKIKNTVHEIVSMLKVPLLETNTQRKFGKIWFENILRNSKSIFENNFSYEPININKKAVLITGAGYSLYENIDLIKKESGNLFIASSDTSLKVLTKFNIIPDLVFSFDSQHNTYYQFSGVKNIPRILSDFTSCLKINKNQTLLFSNHPINSIFKKLGWNLAYLPSNTRNIGGAIIEFFCRYFPEQTVITAGIDYGIYKNYLYSRGTYINEFINIHSNYFSTENLFDAKLLYKEKLNIISGNWKTNELLNGYSNSLKTDKNIYTLSSSPINNFIKITSLNELFYEKNTSKESTLIFEKPGFSRIDFIDLLNEEIRKNPEIIYSYFLNKKIYPSDKEINKITEKINSILKY